MSFKCIYFVAIAISLLSHTLIKGSNIYPSTYKYKYIYQLGDSISDTGNLPFLEPGCVSTKFPYGQSIGNPTGRWSDGFLIIDFIAMSLSLPPLNPYLKPNASFDHGANFAVAGSTILEASSLAPFGIQAPSTNIPISVQLNWFKSHLHNTCGTTKGCKTRLDEALVWIGEMGGNDINYAIIQGKSNNEIVALIRSIVEEIIKAVEEVISLGAVEIVVPGDFPVGCWPVYLILFPSLDPLAYDEMGCLININQISLSFNNHLQGSLALLRSKFPYVRIIYGDYYTTFLAVFRDAHKLGFDRRMLLRPCCGTVERGENNDATLTCGLDGIICSKPSQYIHWDGFHLTQEAYRHISEAILDNILSTSRHVW